MKVGTRLYIFLAILLVFGVWGDLLGAEWPEQDKLVASDGAAEDRFGFSVSVSGDLAIVGAYFDDDNGTNSGSAYIFKRDGEDWYEQYKLTASDGAADDFFGYSVCVSGDYAIVGAHGDDDNGSRSGSAYIFRRDGESWYEQAKLTASDGAADDQFGGSVSVSGDYAIVGSLTDDDNGSESGSAYIFKRDGEDWNEQDKLLASDGAESDFFGYSVSIGGDYAIVGACGDNYSGSAYIFRRDGEDWNEQAKLTASDGAGGDFFGLSVSISGDYAIVGAYFDDDNGMNSGSAYIFKRDGEDWYEQYKLTASDGAGGDRFGDSVSISGDYAIVGSVWDDVNGSESGSAYIFRRDGEDWYEQAKLLASDGAEDDRFGLSVSISGDYAIVGALYDDDSGDNSGSAYIFKREGAGWSNLDKLVASDGAAVDMFGRSVSISGDYAIVGSPYDNDNGSFSGSAYIFKRDGEDWSQQAKLTASDGAGGDSFGFSVSISGDLAIVGAHGDDVNGFYSGSAYIFKRDGEDWSQQYKLLASDGAEDDEFGFSVSISGDYAIVGARGDDDYSGSAYIFRRDGAAWSEQDKLTASDGAAEDNFGCSVSISGDYAIVGAEGEEDSGSEPGSAYIFRREGAAWSEEAKLTASDGVEDNRFGWSVSISGDYAIVGACFDDDNGSGSGSAYIFKRDGEDWYEQDKLTASDGAAGDRFGWSVSISGDYAIVGAEWDDDKGDASGSAYIFRLDGEDWNEQAKLTASDGAAEDGFGVSVSISGDYAIVGAFWDDDNGSESGSAYMFVLRRPDSDLTGDCFVDFRDFSVMGDEYLLDASSLEIDKFTTFDVTAGDWFGTSVSVSGDYAIVGAYWDDDNGSESGSAYIFRFDGMSWYEQDKLTASDGAAEDGFGISVSINGDYAIVGAYLDDVNGSDSGSAYIFKRDGAAWSEQAKLTASDGAAEDGFGVSVSISGDYAIVGASGDDDSGSKSGSAYIFKRDGDDWYERAKLTALDGAEDDYFSYSVSISGDYAIVGAHGDDDNGSRSGSAYIFRRDGESWYEQAKLTASDGADFDQFGGSVSVSGDYAIVGSLTDDDDGSESGSAYIFKRDGAVWSEQAKLTASDGAASDRFGRSVSISGDSAIVGAEGDDDNGDDSGSVYIFRLDGEDWYEQAKLTASDGAGGDWFGISVSISGDYAIVGAIGDDDNGDNSGSAYIFRRDGEDWNEQAKLLASDGSAYDWFGGSVSISGDYAIVGSYPDDYNKINFGSAYIFRFDGMSWSEAVRLTASDIGADDGFGSSVSISGDYAIVGACGDDENGSYSGSAYIFKRDGDYWNEQSKLTASDGTAFDYFGGSVSISGDYAIVGAYFDDDEGTNSGSAYIFKRDGEDWYEQYKLTASDGAEDDYFSCSVSISGDYAIVGSPSDGDNGSFSGSAYIFKRDGEDWNEQDKLLASDGAGYDWFGGSVSISGDYAIVGTYSDDDNGDGSGSAYIFKRDGANWSEEDKLTASDGTGYDRFGVSVSISGDYAIVGSYFDDDNGSDSGSAYIFKRDGEDWYEQAKLTGSDGAAYDWFGVSVSVSGDYFIVGADGDDDKGDSSGSAYMFVLRCPDSDLTGDCFVDFRDLSVMGDEWLEGD